MSYTDPDKYLTVRASGNTAKCTATLGLFIFLVNFNTTVIKVFTLCFLLACLFPKTPLWQIYYLR